MTSRKSSIRHLASHNQAMAEVIESGESLVRSRTNLLTLEKHTQQVAVNYLTSWHGSLMTLKLTSWHPVETKEIKGWARSMIFDMYNRHIVELRRLLIRSGWTMDDVFNRVETYFRHPASKYGAHLHQEQAFAKAIEYYCSSMRWARHELKPLVAR